MKRIVAITAILTVVLAGLATAAGGPAKVKLRNTAVGKILTNGAGFTLYMFTRDRVNSDRCVKIKSCTSVWPPLKTRGKPVAGPGVKASLLGRIRLPNGKSQVTYARHPLYTYVGDSGPGQTSYVGISMFGGRWDALNAAGKAVK